MKEPETKNDETDNEIEGGGPTRTRDHEDRATKAHGLGRCAKTGRKAFKSAMNALPRFIE